MNCDDVQELMVEYLLDELGDDAKFALSNHLQRGCSRCLTCQRETVEGIEGLLTAIPNDPISSQHRSAILANATLAPPPLLIQTVGSSNSGLDANINRYTGSLLYVLAFAAGIVLMAIVVPNHSIDLSDEKAAVQGNSPSNSFAVAPVTIPSDSEIAIVKKTKTLLVSMERSNKSSKIEGQIVWDTLNHEVHFFGSGVTSAPPGMRYVIWLTDQNNQPLATKELTLSENGRCKATIVSSIRDVRYVFLTLESKLVGFTQPSSNVQLSFDASRLNLTKL